MIFGAAIALIGFFVEFYGATRFNFGIMLMGWILVVAGISIFALHVLELIL